VASDPKRLSEVYRHIQFIKTSDYPVIMGNSVEGRGSYRIVDRPWQELQEPSKLVILQDSVDWSGITNRDQATILLSEIDPGRITDAQRTRLIDAALGQPSYQEILREAVSRGSGQLDKDQAMEK
jgi:hypothetical protein